MREVSGAELEKVWKVKTKSLIPIDNWSTWNYDY